MKHLRALTAGLLASAALFLAAPAQAAPITFTYSGEGWGSLDGTAFGTTGFTITATGDTDDRQGSSADGVFTLDHLTASITIDGLGSFTFLSPTRSYVNMQAGAAGFSYGTGHDLFSVYDARFSGWDMLTSVEFAAASGGHLLQWDHMPVETTGGVLYFRDSWPSAAFGAVVGSGETPVPEPLTLTLVGLGLAGVGAAMRRRAA